MGDDFDDFVVEVEEGDKNEHDTHIDEEGKDAAQKEFNKFTEEMLVFDAKNEATVSEVGEGDGDNPGDDVGGLELKGVFWVEDGKYKGIISGEADEGGHYADDKVTDDFAVFDEKSFKHFFDEFLSELTCGGVWLKLTKVWKSW